MNKSPSDPQKKKKSRRLDTQIYEQIHLKPAIYYKYSNHISYMYIKEGYEKLHLMILLYKSHLISLQKFILFHPIQIFHFDQSSIYHIS